MHDAAIKLEFGVKVRCDHRSAVPHPISNFTFISVRVTCVDTAIGNYNFANFGNTQH